MEGAAAVQIARVSYSRPSFGGRRGRADRCAARGGVSVHAANHYDGNADIGRLETSKQDKSNHGFGMKSMKKIVEKYGGTMDVFIADDMFQVDILLPVPAGGGV